MGQYNKESITFGNILTPIAYQNGEGPTVNFEDSALNEFDMPDYLNINRKNVSSDDAGVIFTTNAIDIHWGGAELGDGLGTITTTSDLLKAVQAAYNHGGGGGGQGITLDDIPMASDTQAGLIKTCDHNSWPDENRTSLQRYPLEIDSNGVGYTYLPELSLQGSQGEKGAQGARGTQGSQGTQGVQGTQGPQGTKGSQGTQGVQGTKGSFDTSTLTSDMILSVFNTEAKRRELYDKIAEFINSTPVPQDIILTNNNTDQITIADGEAKDITFTTNVSAITSLVESTASGTGWEARIKTTGGIIHTVTVTNLSSISTAGAIASNHIKVNVTPVDTTNYNSLSKKGINPKIVLSAPTPSSSLSVSPESLSWANSNDHQRVWGYVNGEPNVNINWSLSDLSMTNAFSLADDDTNDSTMTDTGAMVDVYPRITSITTAVISTTYSTDGNELIMDATHSSPSLQYSGKLTASYNDQSITIPLSYHRTLDATAGTFIWRMADGIDPSISVQILNNDNWQNVTANNLMTGVSGSSIKFINNGSSAYTVTAGKLTITNPYCYDQTVSAFTIPATQSQEPYKYYLGATTKEEWTENDLTMTTTERPNSIVIPATTGDEFTAWIYPAEWGRPLTAISSLNNKDQRPAFNYDDFGQLPTEYDGMWIDSQSECTYTLTW